MIKVLLAEDAPNIATMVEICLEDAGYDVISEEDGIEALSSIYANKPDIILLDLVLPRMSGILILKALRENHNTTQIPVIVMSARSQKEDIQEAYDNGADDYLVKPFTPADLLRHVKNLVKGDENGDNSHS
jgi:DNA-binding response OmpR family regulator